MLQRLARRFIAGPTLEKAIVLVREDNLLGVYGILNYLGEHYRDAKHVGVAIEEYVNAIKEIERRKLDAQISVKLTQLGLMISEDTCTRSLGKILREAAEHNVFVWIDMEALEYIPETLVIYTSLVQQYPDLGITLQAYLRRTENDLRNLLPRRAIVRLVKGAYREVHARVGDKEAVRENYKKLLELLFENSQRFAVATHDDELIQHTIELSEEYKTEPEFQLLLGVREGLQIRLAAEGYRVGEYIPYGTEWHHYFRRRVRERRRNTLLAVKDFFWFRHERLARI